MWQRVQFSDQSCVPLLPVSRPTKRGRGVLGTGVLAADFPSALEVAAVLAGAFFPVWQALKVRAAAAAKPSSHEVVERRWSFMFVVG